MSFRTRVTLLTGACVALAVALSAVAAYLVVRERLEGQIDSSLRERAVQTLMRGEPPGGLEQDGAFKLPRQLDDEGVVAQLVLADGRVLRDSFVPALPLPARVRIALRRQPDTVTFEAQVQGVPLRILAVGLPDGSVLEFARPLTSMRELLGRLRTLFAVIAAVGIAIALALGAAVARAALVPVRRLTAEAEQVRATGDLSRRVETSGGAELERLGASFNEMLAALQTSVDAQRQLVADASHELRTPLTSLRTNIEVVDRIEELPPEARASLRRDLRSEIDELTTLVADLVELAAGEAAPAEPEPVQLDALVDDMLVRARRRAPHLDITAQLEPSLVLGVPARLERAIGNLVDNAVKWSPDGGTVEVRVAAGEVSVRDHGPGIDEDDLPHVFDRFWRAPAARGLPGSGLGLAIVKQIADEHHAGLTPESAPGGGTTMRLRLRELPEP